MINSILRFGAIIIILILLQILLFNNIQFSGYVNPYVYIMIILLLPAVIPHWLLLIVSFLTGLIIDLFSGSPGMHTSATLLAGFSRPYVLRIISPRDGYESGPGSFNEGLWIKVVLYLYRNDCSYSPYSTFLS